MDDRGVGDAGRFEQLVPPWMFAVRSGVARAGIAIALPALVVLPWLSVGSRDVRIGPVLVLTLVAVAALAGWRAAALASAIVFLVYWRDGVPPRGELELPGRSSLAALSGMALLCLGLPLLTRRVELAVRDVRGLDEQRQQATAKEAEARREAERIAADFAAVIELSTALAGTSSLVGVAEAALASLSIPVAPTDASIALVVDDHLRMLAAKGSTPGMVARLEQVPLHRVDWLLDVLDGQAAIVDERDEFAAAHPGASVLSLYPGGSWVVVPFRHEGIVGLLSAHFVEPQQLSAHRSYFALVAEVLAAALERASALERRDRHLVELERAFAERDRIARTLSTTLLPPRLPRLEGFTAAGWLIPASGGEVAGDFYDLFAVGDGDWVAILGDVCGKGAEAAAVTSLARYAARTAALSDPNPASVAEVANLALTRDESDLFCTMGIVHYIAAESAIEVALAGHPQPRRVTSAGTTRVGRFGQLLGVAERAAKVERSPFEPGDSIVLFSDGLIERSASFDEAALDAHLAQAAGLDADALAQRLRQLTAGLPAERHDDVAVLVVSRHHRTG